MFKNITLFKTDWLKESVSQPAESFLIHTCMLLLKFCAKKVSTKGRPCSFLKTSNISFSVSFCVSLSLLHIYGGQTGDFT